VIHQSPLEVHHAALRCLSLAEPYYSSGLAGLTYLPPESRRGILIAAKVYREIGEELRRQGPCPNADRIIVPAWRKAAVVARAFTTPSPWTTPVSPHDKTLHRHLDGLVGIHA
jgi:phytoene synthase